jgi:hypothetical protein
MEENKMVEGGRGRRVVRLMSCHVMSCHVMSGVSCRSGTKRENRNEGKGREVGRKNRWNRIRTE